MRNYLVPFIVFFQLLGIAQTQKVCFLGNSYTYVNDLPTLISNIALANGDTLIKDQNAIGGYTLSDHSTNATSIAKIASQDWDYVVLQEQSQLPSFPYQQVQSDVLPYAKVLTDTIRYFHSCVKPIFFNTWGRRDGDPQWDSINTFLKMNNRLYNTYNMMSDDFSTLLSPVGKAYEYIYNDPSAIVSHYDLYASDGSHPSIYGSYLAACVFYQIIFEDSVIGNSYTPGGISSVEKNYLQNVAQYVVTDNLPLDYTQSIAAFTYSIFNDTVFFVNQSEHSFSWEWHFGDGGSDTVENPSHHYTNGQYYVSLTALYCESFDQDSLLINITTGINEYFNEFEIYPNPFVDVLYVKTRISKRVKLFTIEGKLVETFNSNEQVYLPIPKGVYIVEVDGTFRKVLKN